MSSDTIVDIVIGGQNVSTVAAQILEELTVFDGTDSEADTASMELADVEGQTFISQERDPVQIRLGDKRDGIGLVFEGFVSDVRSKGDRRGGRTIHVECSSVDPGGKAKEEREKHWDDQTLGTILKEAFEPAGIPILVAPKFASVKREFEAMDGESPLAFARRLAEEVGASVKMMGPRAVFADRIGGLDLVGVAMPVFEAAWGVNLLEWDLTPIIAKPRWSGFSARWFDFAKNAWNDETEEAEGEAKSLRPALRATKDEAKSAAGSHKTEADRRKAKGSVTVRGSYKPQAGGKCQVRGARSGVDGLYVIASVEHKVGRDGWTTSLDLRQPDGGAGKDGRKTSATGGASVPIPTPRPSSA